MLATSLKTVWARKLRLLMSTFAIVLGVAFVAGSLMFTDSLNRAFSGIMNGTVGDATVVCGDVQTANATVYIVDSVLMPTAKK